MAETNCYKPDTVPIMATIIEESVHFTPKAIDLLQVNKCLCEHDNGTL